LAEELKVKEQENVIIFKTLNRIISPWILYVVHRKCYFIIRENIGLVLSIVFLWLRKIHLFHLCHFQVRWWPKSWKFVLFSPLFKPVDRRRPDLISNLLQPVFQKTSPRTVNHTRNFIVVNFSRQIVFSQNSTWGTTEQLN
jgi:hypothetical protein